MLRCSFFPMPYIFLFTCNVPLNFWPLPLVGGWRMPLPLATGGKTDTPPSLVTRENWPPPFPPMGRLTLLSPGNPLGRLTPPTHWWPVGRLNPPLPLVTHRKIDTISLATRGKIDLFHWWSEGKCPLQCKPVGILIPSIGGQWGKTATKQS